MTSATGMDARRTNLRSPALLIRLAIAAGVLACAAGMVVTAGDRRAGDDEPLPLASPMAIPTLIQLQSNAASRVVLMEVTAYCPCSKCCGPQAQGLTASGKTVDYADGRFVAADTRLLPFGTRVSVPGYHDGQPVEVIDRGGAIKGNKLDVYFPSHQTALEWGRRQVPVTILD